MSGLLRLLLLLFAFVVSECKTVEKDVAKDDVPARDVERAEKLVPLPKESTAKGDNHQDPPHDLPPETAVDKFSPDDKFAPDAPLAPALPFSPDSLPPTTSDRATFIRPWRRSKGHQKWKRKKSGKNRQKKGLRKKGTKLIPQKYAKKWQKREKEEKMPGVSMKQNPFAAKAWPPHQDLSPFVDKKMALSFLSDLTPMVKRRKWLQDLMKAAHDDSGDSVRKYLSSLSSSSSSSSSDDDGDDSEDKFEDEIDDALFKQFINDMKTLHFDHENVDDDDDDDDDDSDEDYSDYLTVKPYGFDPDDMFRKRHHSHKAEQNPDSDGGSTSDRSDEDSSTDDIADDDFDDVFDDDDAVDDDDDVGDDDYNDDYDDDVMDEEGLYDPDDDSKEGSEDTSKREGDIDASNYPYPVDEKFEKFIKDMKKLVYKNSKKLAQMEPDLAKRRRRLLKNAFTRRARARRLVRAQRKRPRGQGSSVQRSRKGRPSGTSHPKHHSERLWHPRRLQHHLQRFQRPARGPRFPFHKLQRPFHRLQRPVLRPRHPSRGPHHSRHRPLRVHRRHPFSRPHRHERPVERPWNPHGRRQQRWRAEWSQLKRQGLRPPFQTRREWIQQQQRGRRFFKCVWQNICKKTEGKLNLGNKTAENNDNTAENNTENSQFPPNRNLTSASQKQTSDSGLEAEAVLPFSSNDENITSVNTTEDSGANITKSEQETSASNTGTSPRTTELKGFDLDLDGKGPVSTVYLGTVEGNKKEVHSISFVRPDGSPDGNNEPVAVRVSYKKDTRSDYESSPDEGEKEAKSSSRRVRRQVDDNYDDDDDNDNDNDDDNNDDNGNVQGYAGRRRQRRRNRQRQRWRQTISDKNGDDDDDSDDNEVSSAEQRRQRRRERRRRLRPHQMEDDDDDNDDDNDNYDDGDVVSLPERRRQQWKDRRRERPQQTQLSTDNNDDDDNDEENDDVDDRPVRRRQHRRRGRARIAVSVSHRRPPRSRHDDDDDDDVRATQPDSGGFGFVQLGRETGYRGGNLADERRNQRRRNRNNRHGRRNGRNRNRNTGPVVSLPTNRDRNDDISHDAVLPARPIIRVSSSHPQPGEIQSIGNNGNNNNGGDSREESVYIRSPFINHRTAYDFLSTQGRARAGGRRTNRNDNEQQAEQWQFSYTMSEGMCEVFDKHFVPTNIGGRCE